MLASIHNYGFLLSLFWVVLADFFFPTAETNLAPDHKKLLEVVFFLDLRRAFGAARAPQPRSGSTTDLRTSEANQENRALSERSHMITLPLNLVFFFKFNE